MGFINKKFLTSGRSIKDSAEYIENDNNKSTPASSFFHDYLSPSIQNK